MPFSFVSGQSIGSDGEVGLRKLPVITVVNIWPVRPEDFYQGAGFVTIDSKFSGDSIVNAEAKLV